MKRLKSSILIFGLLQISFLSARPAPYDSAYHARVAECLNKQLQQYAPPAAMQRTLQHLFARQNFFALLEQQKDPVAFLKMEGFTPLQFSKDKHSAVVVASHELPDYVIKFMRIASPKTRTTKKRGIFKTPAISNRVINADAIQTSIHELGLHHLAVPQKFFYCIDSTAIVVVQKIMPTRTLEDLTPQEIVEVLTLVNAVHGPLDLKARNMMVTDDKIFLIDTERSEEKNSRKWNKYFKTEVARFKKEINPDYIPVVDQFMRGEDVRCPQQGEH